MGLVFMSYGGNEAEYCKAGPLFDGDPNSDLTKMPDAAKFLTFSATAIALSVASLF